MIKVQKRINRDNHQRNKPTEYISNANLFKFDVKYKQTASLDFENKNEQQEYENSIFFNNWNLIFLYVPIYVVFNLLFFNQYTTCEDLIRYNAPKLQISEVKAFKDFEPETGGMGIIRTIFTAILLIGPAFYAKKLPIDKKKLVLRVIVLLVRVLILYNFLSVSCDNYQEGINSIFDESQTSEDFLADRKLLSDYGFTNHAVLGFSVPIKELYLSTLNSIIINCIFRFNLLISSAFLAVEYLVIHIYIQVSTNSYFFISRIIINIFSISFIKNIFSMFFTLATQYYFLKASTELWALYDSFKRSYNTVKTELEDHSMPYVIISKKTGIINYKNNSANELFSKLRKEKRTRRAKEMTFKEIFPTEDKFKEFMHKIENADKDSTVVFLYPFEEEDSDDKHLESRNNITMKESSNRIYFEDNETGQYTKKIWMKVISQSTYYKNQDAYLIQLVTDSSLQQSNIFAKDLNKIIKKLGDLIDEVNIPIEMVSELERNLEELVAKKPINKVYNLNFGSPTPKVNTYYTPAFGSDSRTKKKINTTHQIINILNNSSAFHANNLNFIQDLKVSIPKASFTLAYYYHIYIKAINNMLASHEFLERNVARNTSLDKHSLSLDEECDESNAMKKSFSFKALLNIHSGTCVKPKQDYEITINKSKTIVKTDLSKSPLPLSVNSSSKEELLLAKKMSAVIPKSPQMSAKNLDISKRSPSTRGIINYSHLNKITPSKESMCSNQSVNNYFGSEKYTSLLDTFSINSKILFEEQIQILTPLAAKNKIKINLNCNINEEIFINKTYIEVIFFNIVSFIIENSIPTDRITKESSKLIKSSSKNITLNQIHQLTSNEKQVNIKITKELIRLNKNSHNHLLVSIKFKEGNTHCSYSAFNNLIQMYYKEKTMDLPPNLKYAVDYIDKFNVLGTGIISALYLLSLNPYGEKNLSIDCSDASITTNLSNNVSDSTEIKFHLPYTPNNAIRDSLDKKNSPLFQSEFYMNRIMTKIFKLTLPKKSKIDLEENYEENRKEIFDFGPDTYNDEEENLVPENDKRKIYEPLKKQLNACIELHELPYTHRVIPSSVAREKYPNSLKSILEKSEKIKFIKDSNAKIGMRVNPNFTFNQAMASSNTSLINSIAPQVQETEEKSKQDDKFREFQEVHKKTSGYTLRVIKDKQKWAKWDIRDLKIKYFTPPRYLIVEDNFVGRSGLGRIIKSYNSKHFIDLADNGPEAIEKFSKMICQGYIYDYIFMDIEIPHINGIKVVEIIRQMEKIFNVHSSIAAVTVSNLNEIPKSLFDEIIEKPFNEASMKYVDIHFKKNRPEIISSKD